MSPEEYKIKLTQLARKYPKKYRGCKYILRWDHFWNEKKRIIERCDLTGVKTALDIGTGVGMLPYQLMQQGISVEATDIEIDTTGYLFEEATDLINLPVYYLKITPNQPLSLPKSYDIIFATRTEFDRQENFCWEYFLKDCFIHTNRVVIKTNVGSKVNPFPVRLHTHVYKEDTWILNINSEEFANAD